MLNHGPPVELMKLFFQLYVVGHCTKNSTENEKKIATDATIAALGQFDFEVWTDGLVREKVGAGVGLIFPKKTKYGNKSSKVIKVKAPAGYLCSSFRAEGKFCPKGDSRKTGGDDNWCAIWRKL